MSKIFNRSSQPVIRPKRNTFDMSFASHSTFPMCKLVPVFCKEVLPGDSVHIEPSFGLRFQPLVFPIQSKVHCSLHFFYGRTRNVFDGWRNFIGRTENDGVVFPYHDIAPTRKSQLKTGSLLDYLGVPSTLAGEYTQFATLATGATQLQSPTGVLENGREIDRLAAAQTPIEPLNKVNNWFMLYGDEFSYNTLGDDAMIGALNSYMSAGTPIINFISPTGNFTSPTDCCAMIIPCTSALHYPINTAGKITFKNSIGSFTDGLAVTIYFMLSGKSKNYAQSVPISYAAVEMTYNSAKNIWQGNSLNLAKFNDYLATNEGYISIIVPPTMFSKNLVSTDGKLTTDEDYCSFVNIVSLPVKTSQIRDATDDDTYLANPFIHQDGDDGPKIKLNAVPARLYESIYNFFYRDEVVDPFKPDGIHPDYNEYVRSKAGGADTLNYELYNKNWEKDIFTSCSPTPQQGDAPLVGLSINVNGDISYTDTSDPDNPVTYHGHANYGSDGDTIESVSWFDSHTPKDVIHLFKQNVLQGISISDLRQVNSLQRWLETNIRKGLKYTDQMLSHYGVKPKYNECDVPEFLGGIHRVCDVNTITNTAETDNNPLGTYAGQLYCAGASNHGINKFCDEHGYIIGIMCVYPEPIYSQNLPKHFLKTESFGDYFFPEFGHLSYQPITYSELCPINTRASDIANNTDTLNMPFGYQRAWADMLASTDELHGLMRTDFNDFVVNRIFQDKPQLGHDFIATSEDDINNIFAVNFGDKCIGQFRFNCSFKRPIPRFGIPKLE